MPSRCASSSAVRIISPAMPRERCSGATATALIPAHGTARPPNQCTHREDPEPRDDVLSAADDAEVAHPEPLGPGSRTVRRNAQRQGGDRTETAHLAGVGDGDVEVDGHPGIIASGGGLTPRGRPRRRRRRRGRGPDRSRRAPCLPGGDVEPARPRAQRVRPHLHDDVRLGAERLDGDDLPGLARSRRGPRARDGRPPRASTAARLLDAADGTAPATSTSPSTRAGRRFMRGEPRKAPTKDVAGPLVDLARRRQLQELARAHDGDAVGQRHRLDVVVGDVERGRAEAPDELADLEADVAAERGVEVRERLVEEEDPRLAHDGPAHRDALPLAARRALPGAGRAASRCAAGPPPRRPRVRAARAATPRIRSGNSRISRAVICG